jgi:hypothetical protein
LICIGALSRITDGYATPNNCTNLVHTRCGIFAGACSCESTASAQRSTGASHSTTAKGARDMAWMDPRLGFAAILDARDRIPMAVHWFVPSSPWIYRHPRWDGSLELQLVRRTARWHAQLDAVARLYGES